MAPVPRGRNLLLGDVELSGALMEVAEVLESNRTKHRTGFRRGMPWKHKTLGHHMAKAVGHISKVYSNPSNFTSVLDEETGKSHLAHAIARLLMALALERRNRV